MDVIKKDVTLQEFLTTMGTYVKTSDGTYYYSPYWFVKTAYGLKPIPFDKMPNDLKEFIKKSRNQ